MAPFTAASQKRRLFRAPCGMRHYGRVSTCGEDVRDALVRQWQAIATALPAVDLDVPSRVDGWRNREVVAHLCLQLVVLRRFIATVLMQHAMGSLAANLAGTHSLAEFIDASAREAAELGRVDFAEALDDALPSLRTAGLCLTVVTMQGPIRLVDYLVTRCVEAVVHGSDLVRAGQPGRRCPSHHGPGATRGALSPGSPPRARGARTAAADLDRHRDWTTAGLREPRTSSPCDDLSHRPGISAIGDTAWRRPCADGSARRADPL